MNDHSEHSNKGLGESADGKRMKGASQRPEPGSWVRFVGDGWLDREHIVLEGMLGQALSKACHEGGRATYTSIQMVGARSGHGYPNDWFTVLTGEPTAESLEVSQHLFLERAREIQARRGWMGLVQVGRQIRDENSARRELELQCDRIVSFSRKGRYKEVRGTFRRIGRVLEAFGLHPCGASALELSRQLREQRNDPVLAPALAARVWRWIWLSREAEVPEVTGLLKRPPMPWETSDGGATTRSHPWGKRCPNCGLALSPLGGFAAVLPDKRRIIGGPNPMSRMLCPICGHTFRVKDARMDTVSGDDLALEVTGPWPEDTDE